MISILVPTLGRADRLPALIENVRETTRTGAYELVFVFDVLDGDSQNAVGSRPGPDLVLVLANGTYPAKTNVGYRASSGELVLPTADDVRFRVGWLEAAEEAFADPAVAVVGTNDGSPATADGSHATMPILRRSYVEERGASAEGPGSLFSTSYHHNFVETEVWAIAVARGVARFVFDVEIEHLHPDWGKRELDGTDARGNRASWDADLATFRERMEPWAVIPWT